MFYGIFSKFDADADKFNIKEIFNAETEFLYTLLSTNRKRMKELPKDEHREGIIEFLQTVGYESIFGREFIEDFTSKIIDSVMDLVTILPETANIMLEKFFLVPDVYMMFKYFDTDFTTDHLSRIEFLADEMSKKHFGMSRRKLDEN